MEKVKKNQAATVTKVGKKAEKSGRVLVLGCGNVGGVALHEMAQRRDVFKEIHVATRNSQTAEKVCQLVWTKTEGRIFLHLHQVNASNKKELIRLLKKIKPELVLNFLPPFWNLVVMEACLECRTNYLDTACYEDIKKLGFSNKAQLAMHDAFVQAGVVAQLQFGFDPGVTNVMVAYAIQEQLFDEIESVDILDCNGGSKNAIFAPNFDPEVNLRELALLSKSLCNGSWVSHGRLTGEDNICMLFDFPEIGEDGDSLPAAIHLIYHEELESLHASFPQIKYLRFWMTFNQSYLTYLRVLKNVGMLGIDPISVNGQTVIPIQVLKALLPKGEDFNDSYVGKTCIGVILHGLKNGEKRTIYLYQICDHQESFQLTSGNAVGRTTAVPAMSAAIKMLTDPEWQMPGVFVPESRPAKSFLTELALNDLPCIIKQLDALPIIFEMDFDGEPCCLDDH